MSNSKKRTKTRKGFAKVKKQNRTLCEDALCADERKKLYRFALSSNQNNDDLLENSIITYKNEGEE